MPPLHSELCPLLQLHPPSEDPCWAETWWLTFSKIYIGKTPVPLLAPGNDARWDQRTWASGHVPIIIFDPTSGHCQRLRKERSLFPKEKGDLSRWEKIHGLEELGQCCHSFPCKSFLCLIPSVLNIVVVPSNNFLSQPGIFAFFAQGHCLCSWSPDQSPGGISAHPFCSTVDSLEILVLLQLNEPLPLFMPVLIPILSFS